MLNGFICVCVYIYIKCFCIKNNNNNNRPEKPRSISLISCTSSGAIVVSFVSSFVVVSNAGIFVSNGWLPFAFCIFKQIPPTGWGGGHFESVVTWPTIIVSLKQSCVATASSKKKIFFL